MLISKFQADKALDAAVRLLPYVFMLVAGCLINAALMVRFGYYMPWYFGGGALVVIGSALMCTFSNSFIKYPNPLQR